MAGVRLPISLFHKDINCQSGKFGYKGLIALIAPNKSVIARRKPWQSIEIPTSLCSSG